MAISRQYHKAFELRNTSFHLSDVILLAAAHHYVHLCLSRHAHNVLWAGKIHCDKNPIHKVVLLFSGVLFSLTVYHPVWHRGTCGDPEQYLALNSEGLDHSAVGRTRPWGLADAIDTRRGWGPVYWVVKASRRCEARWGKFHTSCGSHLMKA